MDPDSLTDATSPADTPSRTDQLVILTFHDVSPEASVLAVSPDLFRYACGILTDNGYRTASPNKVARWLDEGNGFPSAAVSVTFDDGYRGVYDHAFPALQQHAFDATVFLTVGGEAVSPERRLPPLNGREMLSWGELREMASAGMKIGAHTCSHPDLTRLPAAAVREEMRVSKEVIEDALGTAVESFAYPLGRWNHDAREIACELFECSVTDRLGLVTRRSDPHALERVDGYYLRSARKFDLVPTSFLKWYVGIRAVPRQLRRTLSGALGR